MFVKKYQVKEVTQASGDEALDLLCGHILIFMVMLIIIILSALCSEFNGDDDTKFKREALIAVRSTLCVSYICFSSAKPVGIIKHCYPLLF